MSSSQRILSGSLTKGSTASLSGSAQYFYQGINANTLPAYLGSLIPRGGSGDRTQLYKGSSPISRTTFDDSIMLNKTLDDIGGASDVRVTERLSFNFESRNMGQAPEMTYNKPYADIISFNPIVYLNDQNEFMWPVNIWNLGSLPKHEYDGVIEPLDIRGEILGTVDTRYEGHATRGALVGAASERPWGSVQICDMWSIQDASPPAFLDAPIILSSSDRPVRQHTNPQTHIQAYQDISTPSAMPYLELDYHSRVYSSIMAHNGKDMQSAIRQLNSSSCRNITDPFMKVATRGGLSSEDAGSIIFNDSFVVGEY
jgi:hypothetical protein